MKTTIHLFAFLIALAILTWPMQAAQKPATNTDKIAANKPREAVKRRVLILDFVNQQNVKAADYLSVSIPEAMIGPLQETGSFELLKRDLGKQQAKGLGIKQSDLASEEAGLKIGKAAGADVVVMGNYIGVGKDMRMQAKALDVISGRVKVSKTKNSKFDSSIFKAIDRLANEMSDAMARELPPLKQRVIVKKEGGWLGDVGIFAAPKFTTSFFMEEDGALGGHLEVSFTNFLVPGLVAGINGGFAKFDNDLSPKISLLVIPIYVGMGYRFDLFGGLFAVPYLQGGMDIGTYKGLEKDIAFQLATAGAGLKLGYEFTRHVSMGVLPTYRAQFDEGEVNQFFDLMLGVGYTL